MPILIEPVKQIEQIEIQPAIKKVEYSQVHAAELGLLLSAVVVVYLLRNPIISFLTFLLKLSVVTFFVYCSYILFLQ